jgi:hypothetical protein
VAGSALQPAFLALAAVVLTWIRWAGPAPFGSDNDEYRMLANSLWWHAAPTVAGVEASKYPFGYSLFIGLPARLGLPITGTALVLNAVIAGIVVLLVYFTSRRLGVVAALVAAAAILTSPELRTAAYTVMPDAAVALVVIGAFAWLLRRPSVYDPWVLATFAFAASMLKSLALTLGIALAAALLTRGTQRRWALAPLAGGLLPFGLVALVNRGHHAASTGYAATFWLRDPGDASIGRIGLGALPGRIWHELPHALAEPGYALFGHHLGLWPTVAIFVALLGVAAAALPRWRLPLITIWLAHTLLLSAWNFRSDRFGLSLAPLGAVGVGALVKIARPATIGRVVVIGCVVALAVSNIGRVGSDAASDARQYGAFNSAVAQLSAWTRGHVAPNESMVSLDYRELSYRLERPVHALPYTRDPEMLLLATRQADAQWLVALQGLYSRRENIAARLVDAYPDQFRQVYSNGLVVVYRIISR